MALPVECEWSEHSTETKHYPSPNFEHSMEHILKQNKSDLNSCDTGPNRAGLFARVSRITLLAKLGLGGDFYNRSAH